MLGISWLTGAAIKGFFGRALKSPWLYVALAFAAIGGGTYFYLNHQTNEAVKTAVQNADQTATIDAYKTKDQAEAQLAPLEEKAERKAEQTRKDYANVRQQIYSHPAPERSQAAPRVIIDTLNALDRVRTDRENADGVSDSEVRAN